MTSPHTPHLSSCCHHHVTVTTVSPSLSGSNITHSTHTSQHTHNTLTTQSPNGHNLHFNQTGLNSCTKTQTLSLTDFELTDKLKQGHASKNHTSHKPWIPCKHEQGCLQHIPGCWGGGSRAG